MSDHGDSDEKPIRLPTPKDAAREIKRKPDEAERFLAKWFTDALNIGHRKGLTEGLARAAEPVKRTTLQAILARTAASHATGNAADATAPSGPGLLKSSQPAAEFAAVIDAPGAA